MDAIDELLTRGVDTVYPTKEDFEKLLRSGKKITLYQGFDPSGISLHIGHMVGLRKLRQFQKLGHKVIFLIGDFTGMIGDPSGKKDARKPLTKEQVLENAKDYKRQVKKILDFEGPNPVEIKFNSDWNSSLSFEDVIRLASNFTATQMLERDMFQERMKEGREISLVEFLYPIMVAYDAVAMNVDLEVGGTDQTFNMLAGRKMHMRMLNKEKFVLTVPLLTDSSGRKLGKTEGNAIAISDQPSEFYGKIMSLGDDAIIPCLQLLTDTTEADIKKISEDLKNGGNPMQHKKYLAHLLTATLNDTDSANNAQKFFEETFQKRELPTDIPVLEIPAVEISLVDLVTANDIVKSRSEAKTLIRDGAIDIDEQRVTDQQYTLTPKTGMIIKIGKHRFIKLQTK